MARIVRSKFIPAEGSAKIVQRRGATARQRVSTTLLLLLSVTAFEGMVQAQTPTPIATKTFTPTPSPTIVLTSTSTPTVTLTPTITSTATITPTPFFCCQCPGFCGSAATSQACTSINTGCLSFENAVCGTGFSCFTATPTRTPANTPTMTPTRTDTPTRTPTPTQTPTATVPMNVDPYKCYRIKPKSSNFQRRTVTLVDQFQEKKTVLLKPLYLCNPSAKGDAQGDDMSELRHPDDHLVCYGIRDENKPKVNIPNVMTRNEIEPEMVNVETFEVHKAKLLCLPSSKALLGQTTPTPTFTATFTATRTPTAAP